MQLIGVTGPSNAGKTTLVEALVERLSERGTVGTVKHVDCEPTIDTEGKDTARHRAAGAERTYGIADGSWFGTGESTTLHDALEELSTDCDYAVVEGYAEMDLPQIVLGEDDATAVLAAESVADIDVDDAVNAIESVEPYETLPSLVADVKRSADADRAGAIATFTGRVRRKDSPDDDPTEYLEFERYDEVATEQLATIREELCDRDGVFDVRLHHRTGVVEAGEDVVYVVVLAGHRKEAFRTVEDGIDRVKDEVPLFKKEVTVSEEFWAHER
ncbi:Molybdopterin synthase catalytic subunit [Halorhabdus sp. SVX81]|uniref:molybdopterin synthase n=1 Tax=Halorhabdus sp. SVX81 TaxID=2978283 RepID=UPI0023DAF638|nr:molybdopterin synthase [Halorhabdus sp. SVX81]WEL17554.1 Molybdopterin synthase catalytic subunit [Halorhabdus sp. SVX81]